MVDKYKSKSFISSCKHFHGKVIGTHNNVNSYENCQKCDDQYENNSDWISILSKSDHGYNIGNINCGYKWQCVEFARRWLILSLGVNFASIPCAYHIMDLEAADNLKTNKEIQFKSYFNGNEEPPMYGDLIIFPKTKKDRWGHVAVATAVNLEKGYVDICEQNYEMGKGWEKPDEYCRRLSLTNSESLYILTEIPYSENAVKVLKNVTNFDSLKKDIIGWKRANI